MSLQKKYFTDALRAIAPQVITLESPLIPGAADAVNALQMRKDWWRCPADIAVIGAGLFFGHTQAMLGQIEWNVKIGVARKGIPAGATDNLLGGVGTLTHTQDFSDYGQDFAWKPKTPLIPADPTDNISLVGGSPGTSPQRIDGLMFGTYYDEDTKGAAAAPAGTQHEPVNMWKDYWYPPGYAMPVNENDPILLAALAAWSTSQLVNWTGTECQAIAWIYYVPLQEWVKQWVR